MNENASTEAADEPTADEKATTDSVVEPASDSGASLCPSCGEQNAPGAQWCEACGASMDGVVGAVDGPPCIDCGADHSEIVEGYCGVCGRKQPAERDHLIEDLNTIAGVTDRGKRHHHNEDAFAIAFVENAFVAVVCDGVSTTDLPEEASQAAATAARDHLVEVLESGETDIAAALAASVTVAQAAASAVPEVPGGQGPGSTTFVASVVRTREDGVVGSWTAWLGDTRAYWLHRDESGELRSTQLTIDDNWSREQVAEGLLSEEEALSDPRAHSITKWLGADAVDATPQIQEFEHDPGGALLVCSDGLWKYLPTDEQLAPKVAEFDDGTCLEVAEALVAFALESGGHDNTTVVFARHDGVEQI